MSSSTMSVDYDLLKEGLLSSQTFLVVFVVAVVAYLIRESTRTNFAAVPGVPEVPGALPFVGHLHLLGGRSGKNDSTVFTDWSKKLGGASIIQCRLGDQRTVIFNDYKEIKDLWVGQANSMIHRPHQPGFVDKLGVDLTGSPMTDQIRKCRAAGMRALAKGMWPKYYHLVEPSSAKLVNDLYQKGGNGASPVDSYFNLRQIVFDLCLSLTYGARFGQVDDAFMIRFIKSINDISAVRSSTETYRHFVPLLRIIPEATSETMAAERVRSHHVDVLYSAYKDRVARGENADCIVASLGADRLTEEEIHGVCISLLQAAPDTVASGVYQTLAWLATPDGRPTQKRCYDAIMEAYGGDRDAAWAGAFQEKAKVPLIEALNKETLRYFVFAPYATPRRTNEDITYKGVTYPKGITMIMNAQEANHDPAQFGDNSWTYDPDRYLGDTNPLPHYAFGAGVRICPAVAISNRLICAILIRMILAFEFEEPAEGEKDKNGNEVPRPNIDPIHFSDVYNQLVAHPSFYCARFKARDELWLQRITREEMLKGAE